MPKSLDLSRLESFQPDPGGKSKAGGPDPASQEPVERWPSRAPIFDGQVSIKAPLDTIARFRRLCKDDRRTYADMLRILMDEFERGQRGNVTTPNSTNRS